ncbi:hypothetical protein Goarm_011933 [Gossypium armourianum]|uniref:Agenet domain-containing protein n=1 Tax=Gossypium armourianum TaxID=34283 RepID=A0A7J9J143_9ROSI|nr:hypothetical protein [Gossypium armourianum]
MTPKRSSHNALRRSSRTEVPPHLQPGSPVEISNSEAGFRDEAGEKALRETFHAFDIGPPAPRETTRKFKFGEEVDAFHNDGWWEGEITKELENGNFHVYFKRSKEQLEFREDKLRLHRERLNGSWLPPLEEAEQVQEVNSIVSLGFF